MALRQLMTGETINERYAQVGGATSGFDYLRIGLAVGVVLQHSFIVVDQAMGDVIWTGWLRSVFGIILPAFFALSGFLVAGSLQKRPTLTAFVSMRAARLLPALAVEILLSAIVLGSLLSEVSWTDYVRSSEFWSYFLNIVGDIHYELPGVFLHNPYAGMVNVSLVTIPYELECYLALVIFYLIGFTRNRNRFLAALGLVILLGCVLMTARYKPVYETSPPSGRSLVAAFLVGVAIQLFADKVRLNLWACLASLAVGALLLKRVELTFIAVIPLAYATIYIGMLNPRRWKLLLSGDYSYGLYLFAFPIQQAQVLLFPQYRWWGYNFAFTLIVGLAYAALSWRLIEAPILSRKREISACAERLVAWAWRRPRLAKLGS